MITSGSAILSKAIHSVVSETNYENLWFNYYLSCNQVLGHKNLISLLNSSIKNGIFLGNFLPVDDLGPPRRL